MVVDDSAIVRGLITRRLQTEPDIVVAASASNGEMAVVELKRHPVDVIVLDIEMPVMDGLTALPQLLAVQPGVKVLVASTLSRRNAEIGMKALQAGAADFLAKPDSLVGAETFNSELLAKLRAFGTSRAPPLQAPTTPRAPIAAPVLGRAAPAPEVIAIGGSTGAPPVLVSLFEALRGKISQPILITQHMPPTFTAILAEQLARSGERPCAEAVDGEPIEAGRAYVAPGGWHMLATRDGRGKPVIRLTQDEAENFCRPAVDPMLRSLAAVYGPGVLAMILTGMGADGAKGCEAVAAAGGRFAVQDEATSVVWGMPGAAARTGLAQAVLPLPEIAFYLSRVAAAPSPHAGATAR